MEKSGLYIRRQPQASRFSFTVCIAIVLSISFGFLGGFISAGIANNDNYSSLYEELLKDLESTKKCVEKERVELSSLKQAYKFGISLQGIVMARSPNLMKKKPRSQTKDQAIFSVFDDSVGLIKKNTSEPGLQRALQHNKHLWLSWQ